jgi:pimeloyl-ACP methyl ester carboxylesterase
VRGTILVLHGIRDSKLSSLASARGHVRRGYRVVILDSRGHGESTGPYLTYGVKEATDLHALVDHLESKGQLTRPLIVIGTSYGAATALQYAAGDARVAKVVAISAFASMRELIPAYLHWALGSFARVIPASSVQAAIRSAGNLAGFDPNRACARCVAARVRAAVLLIASRADERTPYQQSERLRDALGPRAVLRLIDHAQHVDVGRAPGVPETIASWLDL